MKKFLISISLMLLVVGLMFSISRCTQNSRVKKYGGNSTVELDCGEKFVQVIWEEEHLWITTRPMRKDEVPETFTFAERSKTGFMEGKVKIVECR